MSDVLHYVGTLRNWIERGEVMTHRSRALEIATDAASSIRGLDDKARRYEAALYNIIREAESGTDAASSYAMTERLVDIAKEALARGR